MAVDYLKTYLGIDPDDYSAMEARIRGEEPQAQAPVMMRQPMMMPQQRSLGEMEAMPMAPRPQPTPQVDDRYQSLMDEIASLKAQIEGMQAPTEQAPVMADEPVEINMEDAREMFYQSPEFKDYQERTKGMAHDMAYRPQTYTDPVTGKTVSFQDRSGLFQDWYKKTYGRDLSMNSPNRSLPSLSDALKRDSFQAPPELTNRMVGEPQKLPQEPTPIGDIRDTYTPEQVAELERKEIERQAREEANIINKYGSRENLQNQIDAALFTNPVIPQAPSQDIQASIDYLAKLPKMNIPQIPDIEQIRQKMEEANMTFPEPVSYQDQLQSIKDLPKITQMPTREEIQTAMQNIPTSVSANVTQNPFQKINDILPQSTIDQFQTVASKPNPFLRQQPQMQSFGRPQLPFQGGFMPEMRADGGGIDKAIYDLKFKLNG